MISTINGSSYTDLIHSGIKNLEKHRKTLNDLNVFPVPDGDTGTNMVMTLRYGFDSIKEKDRPLSEISRQFSSSAVFGARGNSGVIISQFFKGLSDGLEELEFADCDALASALRNGYEYAYASVSKPVEGTMLTVLKDASDAVISALPLQSINSAIDVYLTEARASLARTPELLPILKKANVVDSGGSGVVYFFEGVRKYLNGEEIEELEDNDDDNETVSEHIDLTLFNKDTSFDYGYCVEGLIQLKIDVSEFDNDKFKRALAEYGESIVSSLEQDKVKLHIHTQSLAPLMGYCQAYGEFLRIKIENMTVQEIQKSKEQEENSKFLYKSEREDADYAVIAVATNKYMQERYFEMGADVVIFSEIAPSSQDFVDAFELARSEKILVFPNSANSILAAMQAGALYEKAMINVLNSRTIAECFATLSILDFESSFEEAIELANETIPSIYQVSVYHAVRNVKYGSRTINKNDFFTLSSNKILDVDSTVEAVTVSTVDRILKEKAYDVVTLYYGKSVSSEIIENLVDSLNELGHCTEFATVSTLETMYEITITFE